jgi:Rieske Fe-S protein
MSMPKDVPEAHPRRVFLKTGLTAVAGLLTIGAIAPLGGCSNAPEDSKKTANWVEVGDIAALTEAQPLEFSYRDTSHDAWSAEANKKLLAVRQPDGSVLALSPKCPHQGCEVAWDQGSKTFVCPCHYGTFDVSGKLLSGPPPHGLDRLTSRVEGSKLFVDIG